MLYMRWTPFSGGLSLKGTKLFKTHLKHFWINYRKYSILQNWVFIFKGSIQKSILFAPYYHFYFIDLSDITNTDNMYETSFHYEGFCTGVCKIMELFCQIFRCLFISSSVNEHLKIFGKKGSIILLTPVEYPHNESYLRFILWYLITPKNRKKHDPPIDWERISYSITGPS